MFKRLVILLLSLFCIIGLSNDVYTVSGIGDEGDPFIFIDGKITFVTNLTPEEAPEGTTVEIYDLTERQNVNFAQGTVVEEEIKTDDTQPEEEIYTVSGIGREGDPFIFIDEKITFVTNLTPEEAPEGTEIKIYELVERENVNFAEGILAEEERKPEERPDNVYEVAGIGREGDPFVRIDDKITFVTNITPEQAPKGSLIEIYDVQERETVNFAEGRVYTEPTEEEPPSERETDEKELEENDVIDLSITMISAEGHGMGFYGHYLVYVPDAEVGDTVNVKIETIEDLIARGSKTE